MVQWQGVMYVIARSRFQIKSKLVEGSSKNVVLIFSMAGALSRVQYAFLQVSEGTDALFYESRLNE